VVTRSSGRGFSGRRRQHVLQPIGLPRIGVRVSRDDGWVDGGRRADPDRVLAGRALAQIGCSERLNRVATGLDSTYRANIADGTVLAVRVAGPWPFRSPAATLTEARWMTALATETTVRVAPVVAPTGGDPLVVDDDEGRQRGCIVVGWVAGRKARRQFNRHHAFALGGAAAHLHAHAVEFTPPSKGWAKSWDATLMCGPAAARDQLPRVAGQDAVEVVAGIERLLAEAMDGLGDRGRSLINADLGPHNVVWSGTSPGLFDFNDLGFGYQAWDLARYLHGLRWRENGQELVDAALSGYTSIGHLPVGFAEHGDLFEAAAGLFLAHHLAGKISDRGPATARRVVELLASAQETLTRR
jgi:Ser/Thr protein kinase RdoA (MazF antagonist)